MKIWLDDLRVAPDGYETAKSVNEAIDLIEECEQNGEEIAVSYTHLTLPTKLDV